ncbi:MAG: protein kinase [Phycisphaerales bacterium]
MNAPPSEPPRPSLAAIRRVFSEALERPEAEREAFIGTAARGDAELARRVHELLATMTRAGGYLDAPPRIGHPPASMYKSGEFAGVPAEAEALVGTTLGPYRLVEVIGEGGFGVVFLAEQDEPIRRRVALKIIKAGMDSREVLARFDAERQALAMMDHPNIARVLDAGATREGRPFFVMELVRGVPITVFCDEQRLAPRPRLELLERVCHAVQHAHQKGVIHRDIKPANVLVTLQDGEPVPKVIDFGIAKAVSGRLGDASVLTQFRAMLGTPASMSPEQVEGQDVDTRTDVYSLGVMMYELLTGSTPLDGRALASAGPRAMSRLIRDGRPERPSVRIAASGVEVAERRGADAARLSRALRGELDWIVMRAIEPERSRRYDTAEALAADIRRHLRGEPVVARPPSTLYLATTFARRNRGLFAAAAAVALTLVAGIIASTWGFLSARHESQLKDAALASESQERVNARRVAYRASLAAATLAIENADSKLAARSLEDAPEELRGWEWAHLRARADQSVFQVSLPSIDGRGFTHAPEFLGGSHVVIGGEGTPARVYDFGDGSLVAELPGGASRGLAISEGRDRIAVLNTHGRLACFVPPWKGAVPAWTLDGVSRLDPLAFTSDGLALAVVREDDVTLSLVDARDGRVRHEVALTEPIGYGASYIPDRDRFCVRAGAHHTWRAFRADDLSPTDDNMAVPAWVPVGRGRWLASEYLGRVSLCRPWKQEEVIWAAEPGRRRSYGSVQVTPGGEMAVASDQSGGIVFWGVAGNEELGSVLGAGGPSHVSISDDGRWVGASDDSGRVMVFSTAADPRPFDLPYDGVDQRRACAFASSGRLGAAASWGVVETWDPATGERLWTRSLSRWLMAALAVSRDGQRVASASTGSVGQPYNAARAELFVLDAASGRTVLHRTALGFVILGLEAEAGESGGWLASCDDGVIRRLDGSTGEVLEVSAQKPGRDQTAIGLIRMAEGAPRAVTLAGIFAPTRTGAPRKEDADVVVWNTRDLAVELTLRCRRGRAISAAISADGGLVAAITDSGDMQCWDAAGAGSGAERWSIHDQALEAASLAFSPDASRLAVVGSDGILRVVDVATGQVTVHLTGPWPLEQWRFVDEGRSLVGGGIRLMSRLLETSRNGAGSRDTSEQGRARMVQVRAAELLRNNEDADGLTLSADRAARARIDDTVGTDVREAAATRSTRRGDRHNYLNSAATAIVIRPGLMHGEYERAVAAMQAVCAAWPDDSSFVNTLATAYYRCERFADARKMFERGTALRRARGRPAHPIDLLMLGATLIGEGQAEAGAGQIRAGLEAIEAQGLASDYEVRMWREEALAVAARAQVSIPLSATATPAGSRR